MVEEDLAVVAVTEEAVEEAAVSLGGGLFEAVRLKLGGKQTSQKLKGVLEKLGGVNMHGKREHGHSREPE